MTTKKRAQAADARLAARYVYRTTEEQDSARSAAIAREHDRRSVTSRANLAGHVPERLADDDTVVLSVRLSRRERQRLTDEAAANGSTLSEHVRSLLTRG